MSFSPKVSQVPIAASADTAAKLAFRPSQMERLLLEFERRQQARDMRSFQAADVRESLPQIMHPFAGSILPMCDAFLQHNYSVWRRGATTHHDRG